MMNSLFFLLCAMCLSSVTQAVSFPKFFHPKPVSSSDLHDQADEAYANKKFTQATIKYQQARAQALKESRTDAEINMISYDLAIALFDSKAYEDAIAEIDQILASDPTNIRLQLFKVECLVESKDKKKRSEALDLLNKLKQDPELTPADRIHLLQLIDAVELKLTREYIKIEQLTSRLQRTHGALSRELLLEKAQLWMKLENWIQAMKTLNELLQKNNKHWHATLLKSTCLQKLRGLHNLRMAISLITNFRGHLTPEEEEQKEQAVHHLKLQMQPAPPSEDVLANRRLLDLFDKVITTAKHSTTSPQKAIAVLYYKAGALFVQSQYNEAIEVVDEILLSEPSYFEAKLLKARCLSTFQDDEHYLQAQALYKELSKQAPAQYKEPLAALINAMEEKLSLYTQRMSSLQNLTIEIEHANEQSQASKMRDLIVEKGNLFIAMDNWEEATKSADFVFDMAPSNWAVALLKAKCLEHAQGAENIQHALAILKPFKGKVSQNEFEPIWQKLQVLRPTAANLHKQGKKHLHRKENSQAIRAFDQALEKADDAVEFLDIHLSTARGYMQEEKYEKALEHLDAILTTKVREIRFFRGKVNEQKKMLIVQAKLFKAYCLYKFQDLEHLREALDLFAQVKQSPELKRIDPLEFEHVQHELAERVLIVQMAQLERLKQPLVNAVRNSLGNEIVRLSMEKCQVLYAMGKWHEALKMANFLLELETNNWDATLVKAKIINEMGPKEDTEASQYDHVENVLAIVNNFKGDLPQEKMHTREEFVRSILNERKSVHQMHQQGLEYYQDTQMNKAIDSYTQAIAEARRKKFRTKRINNMVYDKAMALYKLKAYAAAMKDLNSIVQTNPRHFRALLLKARIFLCQRHFIEAQQTLDQIFHIDAMAVEANLIKTRLFLLQNMFGIDEVAHLILEDILDEDPSHPEAIYLQAWCLSLSSEKQRLHDAMDLLKHLQETKAHSDHFDDDDIADLQSEIGRNL